MSNKHPLGDRVLLAFLCGEWRTHELARALHATPQYVRQAVVELRCIRHLKLSRVEHLPRRIARPRIYYTITPQGIAAAKEIIHAHR